jgi:hypothetical protein
MRKSDFKALAEVGKSLREIQRQLTVLYTNGPLRSLAKIEREAYDALSERAQTSGKGLTRLSLVDDLETAAVGFDALVDDIDELCGEIETLAEGL